MLKNGLKYKESSRINNIAKLFSCMALASTITVLPVCAQQIIIDGNTNTSLNVNGNKTTITTTTIKNDNAFNSFKRFNIHNDNVVDLIVPDNSKNLINLVHNEKSSINGILNAVKNNQIGGNIYFVNPYGITVGSEGVINVGSLTAVTPTTQFMKNFFDRRGRINDSYVDDLLEGNAPINRNADITINGTIKAIEFVKLDSYNVINNGNIQISSNFENSENEVDANDIVNLESQEEGTELALINGEIIIKAENNFTNIGSLTVDGSENRSAGNISIIADEDINIRNNSLISARGIGANSNGGNITFNAESVNFDQGSKVYTYADSGFESGNIKINTDNIDINASSIPAELNAGTGDVYINRISSGDIVVNDSSGLIVKIIKWIFNVKELDLSGDELSQIHANTIYLGNEVSEETAQVSNNANGNANGKGNGKGNGRGNGNGNSQDIVDQPQDYTDTITVEGVVNLDSNLVLSANETVVDAEINTTGNIELYSADESFMAGNITSGGNIVLSSEADSILSVSKNFPDTKVIAQGDITITATEKKGLASIGDGSKNKNSINVFAGGDINIEGYDNAEITGKNTVVSADNVYLKANRKEAGLYDDANIIALNTVNITANTKNVEIDGTITAGTARSALLLVNSNGKIDKSSTINATINGGNVLVNEEQIIGGAGGSIILSGKKITGSGTLIVNGGNGTAELINNSDLNLQINDLSIDYGTQGSITINGDDVTSKYKSINVIINNNDDPGNIDITNNSSSGILLGGTISSYYSDISINNLSGDIVNLGDNLLVANNIVISAANILNYANFDISDSTLINSSADVYISGATGNITASTAGSFHYSDIIANEVNIDSSGNAVLYNGIVAGNAVINNINTIDPSLTGISVGTIENNVIINGFVIADSSADMNITGSVGEYVSATSGNDMNITGTVGKYVSATSGNDMNITGSVGEYVSATSRNDMNITGSVGEYVSATSGNDMNITGSVGEYVSATSGNDMNITGSVGEYVSATSGNDMTVTGIIGDYFEGNSLNNLNLTGIIGTTVTAVASDVSIYEYDDVNLKWVIATNNVDITSDGGSIIDSRIEEEANITANTINLWATDNIGDAKLSDLNIISENEVNAYSDMGNIHLSENDADILIGNINANVGDVTLQSAGNILDTIDSLVSGYDLALYAGFNSSIGSNVSDGALKIETKADGTLTAIAPEGNVYIHEIGDNETIIVDTVQAKDEIYLRADWKLQNFEGATISTTAENSLITLLTDDTKLYDDNTESGGSISTGAGGKILISRTSAGDIYAGYTGLDNELHPEPGETTYVTTRELNMISSEYVELFAPEGEEIWESVEELNIIIDDDYNFIAHPVDVADGAIYILRATDGILTLGGYIDGIGVITQEEIDNITANDILLGNVLNPTKYKFGDTTEIRLISPDFSHTSSTGEASNVTLSTSGSILDYSDTGQQVYAKNLTLIADCYDDGTGAIGMDSSGNVNYIDIYLSGELNAKATENINLFQKQHLNEDNILNLGTVESTQGSVSLYLGAGLVGTTSNPDRNYVNVLLDANGDTDNIIAANNINLTVLRTYKYSSVQRKLGSIGSEEDFIEINSATSGSGAVTSTSTYIYLNETEGDLNLNTINSYNNVFEGIVYLKATDSNGANITDANNNISSSSTYNILSEVTTLEASYGSIGSGELRGTGAINLYGRTKLTAIAGNELDEPATVSFDHFGSFSGSTPVLINSIQTNENSTVNFFTLYDSLADNFTDLDNNIDIKAKYINLGIGGNIGNYYDVNYNTTRTARLEIDIAYGGYLNTSATELIYMAANTDIPLYEVKLNSNNANGAINLASLNNGNVFNVRPDEKANIIASSIKCTPGIILAGNNIGSLEKPVQLDINTGDRDYLQTTSAGSTYINNQNEIGAIQIGFSSSGGEYHLTSANDIMLLRVESPDQATVKAAGSVYLNSEANIYDNQSFVYFSYNEKALIKSDNITLQAGGYIGTDEISDIEIENYTEGAAVILNVNSLTGDNIIIKSYSDIELGEIISYDGIEKYGDVQLETSGSIITNTTYPAINITGNNIDLTATNVIGSESNPVIIDSSGTIITNSTEIHIEEQ